MSLKENRRPCGRSQTILTRSKYNWKAGKVQSASKGLKFDNDKDRWDLLPFETVEQIVKVLTFGASKYNDHNWKLVENGKERYFAACHRHLATWRKGETNDEQTGLPHLAHAMTNLLFILYLEQQAATKADEQYTINSESCGLNMRPKQLNFD